MGDYIVDFQFQGNERFVSATAGEANDNPRPGATVTSERLFRTLRGDEARLGWSLCSGGHNAPLRFHRHQRVDRS